MVIVLYVFPELMCLITGSFYPLKIPSHFPNPAYLSFMSYFYSLEISPLPDRWFRSSFSHFLDSSYSGWSFLLLYRSFLLDVVLSFALVVYTTDAISLKKNRKSKKAAGQNLNLSSMAAQGLCSGSLVRQRRRLYPMVSVDEGLAPCPRRWALKLSGSLARLLDQVGLKIMLHYWVALLVL